MEINLEKQLRKLDKNFRKMLKICLKFREN